MRKVFFIEEDILTVNIFNVISINRVISKIILKIT
jgi:hypothetical protein